MELVTRNDSDLLKALVTVQEKLLPMAKDADNPYAESKYLTLASILTVAKPLLSQHGIAFLQGVDMDAENLTVTTCLAHENGAESVRIASQVNLQAISSLVTKGDKSRMNPIQMLGSAMSYLRRYQTMTILGLVGDDDDDGANIPQGDMPVKKKPKPIPRQPIRSEPEEVNRMPTKPDREQGELPIDEEVDPEAKAAFIDLVNKKLPATGSYKQKWMQRYFKVINDDAAVTALYKELQEVEVDSE